MIKVEGENTPNMTEESDFTHGVFQNDPVYLLSYIDKYATIKTKYSTQESGFVRAIDPVTESIVIELQDKDKTITKVIMGHCITELTSEQPPPGCEPANKPTEELDPQEVDRRKHAVLKWFKNNLLPVEDVDGVLQVHGEHLCILPPYTVDDCISNNSIILGRIQELLHSMPQIGETADNNT